MKVYVFGAYKNFECMAGKCQATCCSGWKIVVDKEAYKRFKNMDDEILKEDIMSNIIENDGIFSFKNMASGDCAMLDSDGLCRIQRNSDEETLCNTCRKYPRLSFKSEENMLLSMAASCPVVIDYLCNAKCSDIWYEMTDDKKMHAVAFEAIPGLSYEIERFDDIFEKIREKHLKSIDKMCELFYDFADIAVDMIIKCNDCVYIDGSLDIYEEQLTETAFKEKYDEFFDVYGEKLLKFEKNYRIYRILTGSFENSSQSLTERLYQIAGELIMNRVILFSLIQVKESGFGSNIVQSVHWVYKAAVHGKKSGSIMHKKVLEKLAQ